MTAPFRFAPPVLRPGLLLRRRLLGRLTCRWERRLTLVVGGPGLGKTTLLAQAVAENRLSPRGEDLWLGCEASDADEEHLAVGLLAALGADARPSARWAEAVAEAVWLRSPDHVCLVLDDVHDLPTASPGLGLLADLLDVLPVNAHVVISSREPPDLPVARLMAQGRVAEVDEAALRFSPEEVEALAAARNVDAERLRPAGGWPAIVELAARTRGATGRDFLWQEVLDPLPSDRRRILAVVVDLGGADDALASAALDQPVGLDDALAGVPLVEVDDRGWHAAHPLWATVPALRLDERTRTASRRRAARELVERGWLDRAFELLAGAGLWQDVPLVLVRDCAGPFRHSASQLRGWLDRCPDAVVASPAGQLAQGVLARLSEPDTAEVPLRRAWSALGEAGDEEGELAAMVNLGHLAWWRQDRAVLGELAPRVDVLARTGHPAAIGLSRLGSALVADIAGETDTVLAELDAVPVDSLDPEWTSIVGWLRATQLHVLGELDGALGAVEAVRPGAPPLFRLTIDALRLTVRFHLGQVDVLEEYPELLGAAEGAGAVQNLAGWAAEASRAASHVGDLAAAEQYLRRATAVSHHAQAGARVRLGVAEASLAVARGDEAAARAALRRVAERVPPATGATRRAWLDGFALTYVVCPEARRHLGAMQLEGCWAVARDVACDLIAVREGGRHGALARRELPPAAELRGALHHRLAAELAVHLPGVGRGEGTALLDALGPPGRRAVRDLAAGSAPGVARAARGLLVAVPAPPAERLRVLALGPLELRRGGCAVSHADWRRRRVRELLGYLVIHPRARREAVTAALWPDLHERSAANNLRFTLMCLLRVLEPARPEREAAFLIRQEGPLVRLVTGPHLSLDTDDFDRFLEAAAAAERDGTPSVALADYFRATELHRGEYLADLADAEWAGLSRERHRSRFLHAAVRAGQLLVAKGDLDRAEDLAHRAIGAEDWSEGAYAVLASVWLGRGDRGAARRSVEQGIAMLVDLGLEPSEATLRLQRRLS